jgi:hypothetical protein
MIYTKDQVIKYLQDCQNRASQEDKEQEEANKTN